MMKYYSTNHIASSVDFREALMKGLASDGGLYFPEEIPHLSWKDLRGMAETGYPALATSILLKYTGLPRESLMMMAKDAYNFDIPVEQVDEATWIMRLDRGPTASFKDFAARMMARLMQYYRQDQDSELHILVATSGDTGSAIASAFYGLKGIIVTVLFPVDEVSERQRRQMTTLGGNIRVLGIRGKFDDCQSLVKKAFMDPDLKGMNLTSANSINIGRLIPQSVYYFWACIQLTLQKNDDRMIFSVPSGNFGNLTGGLLARRMGMPNARFICATNANDAFPKYLETGHYQIISPSINCISNAMNVGHPSNMSRLLSLYGGQMDENGKIGTEPDKRRLTHDISSVSVSDQQTRDTIRRIWTSRRVMLEPHGAVAWRAAEIWREKNQSEKDLPVVVIETAHPAKFPDEITPLTGTEPDVHPALQQIMLKEEQYSKIPADYDNFKTILLSGYGKGF